MSSPERPSFVLYLRPFSSDVISVSNPFRSSLILLPSNKDEEPRIRLSALLTRVSPRPLIQIGGRDTEAGPGKISTQDASWKEKASLLIEHASAIVMVPIYSASTLWELEEIHERDHLYKTTLVIPSNSSRPDVEKMLDFLARKSRAVPGAESYDMMFWYDARHEQNPAVERLKTRAIKRRLGQFL